MRHSEARDPDQLLTVDQVAEEYELGRSTVWLYLRRYQVPRFRTAATGKVTLVRRRDWEQAMHTPVAVSRRGGRHSHQKESKRRSWPW
jgi:hypothetical protein